MNIHIYLYTNIYIYIYISKAAPTARHRARVFSTSVIGRMRWKYTCKSLASDSLEPAHFFLVGFHWKGSLYLIIYAQVYLYISISYKCRILLKRSRGESIFWMPCFVWDCRGQGSVFNMQYIAYIHFILYIQNKKRIE